MYLPMAMVLFSYFARYWHMYICLYGQSCDKQNVLHLWVTKFFKVWGSTCVPSVCRSSAIYSQNNKRADLIPKSCLKGLLRSTVFKLRLTKISKYKMLPQSRIIWKRSQFSACTRDIQYAAYWKVSQDHQLKTKTQYKW